MKKLTKEEMVRVKDQVFMWWLENIVSSLTITEWCQILDYTEETSPSRLVERKTSRDDELIKALFDALSDDDLVEVVGPHVIEHIMRELKDSLPIKVERLKLD